MVNENAAIKGEYLCTAVIAREDMVSRVQARAQTHRYAMQVSQTLIEHAAGRLAE
jgi:hypothetical protein